MTITVEAVYEHGLLKLAQPLPLREHEQVRVTVHTAENPVRRTQGRIGWQGPPETGERTSLDALEEL
jgi:predicted DNA-binding antitoxin AbrB/MazE fold protein